jgi:hypothetical protein
VDGDRAGLPRGAGGERLAVAHEGEVARGGGADPVGDEGARVARAAEARAEAEARRAEAFEGQRGHPVGDPLRAHVEGPRARGLRGALEGEDHRVARGLVAGAHADPPGVGLGGVDAPGVAQVGAAREHRVEGGEGHRGAPRNLSTLHTAGSSLASDRVDYGPCRA